METPHFWWRNRLSWQARVLQPVAALYAQAAEWHGAWRARRPYFASVPVISVGNLTLGGAGKTQVVQWLATYFARQGKQVAIVSRGYGGHETSQPLAVRPEHTAWQVGDEPKALAHHFAHQSVTVWVARHRPSGVRRAEEAGAQIVILDDGFQRRDVARQVDILVVHGMRGFGNGLTLPAGPLREPLTALQRADFALVLNEPPVPPGMPPPFYGMPAYRLVTVPTAESVAPLRGKPLVAFAGLAEPQGFFRQLAAAGLTLKAALAYPDHHVYTAADVATLQARAKQHRATLVTTSKDAPKLPAGLAQVLETYLAGPDVADIVTQLERMLEEPAR